MSDTTTQQHQQPTSQTYNNYNNTNNNQPVAAQQIEEAFRLIDFWHLFVPKWYWFVFSVAITMAVAIFYIKRTVPMYTRSSSILIQENDGRKGGGMAAMSNEFQNLGIFRSSQNIRNELLTITSPDLMQEVVARLKLNENYRIKNRFRNDDLYHDSPILVTMPQSSNLQSLSFSIVPISETEVEMSNITYIDDEDLRVEVEKVLRIKFGKTVKTPVGVMIINKTEHFSNKTVGSEIIYSRGSVVYSANSYSSRLSADLGDKEATIINLTINDASKQRAEDILNELVKVYNEQWVKNKNQIAVATSEFINERMAIIEKELDNVDESISDYKSENKLPDITAVSNQFLQRGNQNEAAIMELSSQIVTAQYIQKQLKKHNLTQPLPANTTLRDASVQSQIAQYNTLLLERNKLLANSGENNPIIQDYTQSLNALNGAIQLSIDNALLALENQLGDLTSQKGEISAELANKPKQAKQLLTAERQQKVKEALYLYLLQKREENELNQTFTAYNTRIIQKPRGGNSPTSPRRMYIYLIAFVLGLVIPGTIIYMKETMNTRVRGRKDLDKLTVPFVGEIPLAEKVLEKNKKKLFRKRGSRRGEVHPLVVKERKRDLLNEAFRVVRTNLEFMLGTDGKKKVIMMTSANPGSGKTFITANIAMSVAIKNKKTVCLDFDLRRASMSEYVNKPSMGVTNYITGQVSDWRDVTVKGQLHKNLDVIPVGTIPPNPAELLFSERINTMMEDLRKEYDYIFIDCPPVEIVADTSIIGKWADMTLFVIRAELMDREMLPVIENIYQEKKFNNMSVILNGTVIQHTGRYGYSYRYGYHYGYAYGYSHYGYGYGYGYGSKHSYGYGYYDSDDNDDDDDDKKSSKKK